MLIRNSFIALKVLGRRLARSHQGFAAVLAVLIGLAVAGGVIGFREMLDGFRALFLGFAEESVVTLAAGQPWWRILLAPVAGGLLVGILLKYWLAGGRAEGVAHVMEASALKGARLSLATGVKSAVVSALSLGAGASTGGEGAAVHIGATIGSVVAGRLGLSDELARTLLGCGAAAAVAASFNAPFAGVFFALEVVVGHYALSAFAPIVLASVTATVLTRGHYGDFPAFLLPDRVGAVSIVELPAFLVLGLLSAGLAIAFMALVIQATRWGDRLKLPLVVKPALGGLVVGTMALGFPHLLGVGYEATDMALKEQLGLATMAALVLLKMLATAVSIGAGFGGGVFSPSLFLGAMLGGSFGHLVTRLMEDLSSGSGAYTLVGMGAVAGAVLGAPISTILIMFEMTGDYKLTMAVMIAVVAAAVVTEQTVGQSLFTWQLKARGIDLKRDREREHLARFSVGPLMRTGAATLPPTAALDAVMQALRAADHGEVYVVDEDGGLVGVIDVIDLIRAAGPGAPPTARDLMQPDPPALAPGDALMAAMDLMDSAGRSRLVVVDEGRRPIGIAHQHDVIRAYHQALGEIRAGAPAAGQR